MKVNLYYDTLQDRMSFSADTGTHRCAVVETTGDVFPVGKGPERRLACGKTPRTATQVLLLALSGQSGLRVVEFLHHARHTLGDASRIQPPRSPR